MEPKPYEIHLDHFVLGDGIYRVSMDNNLVLTMKDEIGGISGGINLDLEGGYNLLRSRKVLEDFMDQYGDLPLKMMFKGLVGNQPSNPEYRQFVKNILDLVEENGIIENGYELFRLYDEVQKLERVRRKNSIQLGQLGKVVGKLAFFQRQQGIEIFDPYSAGHADVLIIRSDGIDSVVHDLFE